MKAWSPRNLKKRATRTYRRFGGSDVVKRREVMTAFAKKHDLIYFHTVSSDDEAAPVIRGLTSAHGQVDSNFCIGSHAGYDMALIERTSDVAFVGFETTLQQWYILEIDLKQAQSLPFIFLGTKQLTKAFYAKVLTSHRNIRYLQLEAPSSHTSAFHGHHALIASPAELVRIHQLFSQDVIEMIGTHKRPFNVEIEGDSLIVFTSAEKPSEQLVNQLLHYGLWLARHIDEHLV